jgi:hypothetical protein
MGFRIGRRLVPSSTIRDRMDRKDLRFQADARRRAERRPLPASALLASGFHQSAVDAVQRTRTEAPQAEARLECQTYRLPDGRHVEIDATAAKGQLLVSFMFADGRVVDAVRVDR